MFKKVLSIIMITAIMMTMFAGQITWATDEIATVIADNNWDGNASWQSATLTETETPGTYILTNTDPGAGYSFTWIPATKTLSQNANSIAPTEVVVPSFINGVNVTTLGSNFIKKAATHILLRVIVSEGITTLANAAFHSHEKLQNVTLPSTLKTIGESVFYKSKALRYIDIPEGVTQIGYQAFKQSGIYEITLPSTMPLKPAPDIFSECTALKHVTFMGRVNAFDWGLFYKTTAMETMTFMHPTALTSVHSQTFLQASTKLVVFYPEDGVGYDTEAFRALFLPGTTFHVIGWIPPEDPEDPEPGEVVDATVVAANDLDGNPTWQAATLTATETSGTFILTNTEAGAGYSFTWVPATNTLSQDANSIAPAKVVIPSSVNGVNVLTLGANHIKKADPQILESVVISEGIKTLGNSAFHSHNLLQTVVMPPTLTKIGESVFLGCSRLRQIDIPEGVTEIGYQTFKSTGLLEITLPSTLGSVTGDLFSACKSLKHVTFMGYIGSLTWGVFNGTSALETMTFMNNTAMTSIWSLENTFGGSSTNLLVLYPKDGVGYDTDAFRALFLPGTTFRVYGATNAEIYSATVEEGICNVSYKIDVSDEDQASGSTIFIALYQENKLIACKTAAYGSTQATFATDQADFVKAYVWETSTITPLCEPAYSPIVPAAPRQRVMNLDGTVVTAEGELLRGVYVETDYSTSNLSYAQVAAIKDYGCNTLHLYAERASASLPAGSKLARVDDYVAMTEELGLYCILTVGDSTFNEPFNTAFWEIYAPRYKDKTHVIYEIQNESNGFSPPTQDLLIKTKNAYNRIRELAPDTHILLFSYSHLSGAADIMNHIDALEIEDWSKAAIAWHGYDKNISDYISFFNSLKNAGYASINTELPSKLDKNASAELIQVCEDLGCSWNHFVNAGNIKNDDYWKNPIEIGGVIWKPDFGTWPNKNLKSAFLAMKATNYSLSSGINVASCTNGDNYVTNISDGDYIAFNNINFSTGPAIFDAIVASQTEGGSIELRLGGVDGDLIGTCNISSTGGLDTWERQSCYISGATGVHSLYLVFRGTGENLLNLKQFKFDMTPINPYERVEAEDYTEHYGIDIGACNEGGMNICAIQENDYIAFDNVDFGAGATSFEIRAASALCSSVVELRLDSYDGPLIGTCFLPVTGGWQNWQTQTCLISGATGRHKLFLIFKEGTHQGGYGNVNWFQFY